MTPLRLIQELNKRKVNLLVVQATSQTGSNLRRLFADLNKQGGPRVAVISYKPEGMDRLIVAAIDKALSDQSQSRAVDDNKTLLSESIVNMGGIPVLPRDLDFKAAAIRIEKLAESIPKTAEWINLPAWVVMNEDLMKLQ
jgi:hypothetical protein